MAQQEEVLSGGNVNQVVRIGETVRRHVKPNPYVVELLLHLEKVGYDHAPRFLGIDEQGEKRSLTSKASFQAMTTLI